MIDLDPEYQAALDYLYTFVDFSLTRNFQYSPETFNLDRMQALLARLGSPHRSAPVIHVAGTKGKGSTVALIASALQAAGYTVGFYTSPHLEDFCERIQVDGRPISHPDLVALVARLKPVVELLPQPATFFEMDHRPRLSIFRPTRRAPPWSSKWGWAGAWTSTNVVDPLVSVITSLSLDHMAVLGDTLEKIAFEKAGIIKPGRPVISAPQSEEAARVLVRIAAERGCPLVLVGQDVFYTSLAHDLDGQDCLVWRAEEQPLVDAFLETGRLAPGPLRLHIPLLGQPPGPKRRRRRCRPGGGRRQGLPLLRCAIERALPASAGRGASKSSSATRSW